MSQEEQEQDDALDVSDVPERVGELIGIFVAVLGVVVAVSMIGVSGFWSLTICCAASLYAADQIRHLIAHRKMCWDLNDISIRRLFSHRQLAVVVVPLQGERHVTLFAGLPPPYVPYRFYWWSFGTRVPHVFLVATSNLNVLVDIDKDEAGAAVLGVRFIADCSLEFIKQAIGPTAEGFVNPASAISGLIVKIVQEEGAVHLSKQQNRNDRLLCKALQEKLKEHGVQARDFSVEHRSQPAVH